MTSTTEHLLRLDLWPDRPPHALGDRPEDRPFLEVCLPDPDRATGAAMLALPGGCYTFLSPKSGIDYARWLAANGIVGIAVHFRLGANGYHWPAIYADGRQALAVTHQHAAEWGVDPARIGVIGTSAGGHLATMLITGAAFDDPAEAERLRPAAGVLCYPVVSLLDPIAHAETRGNLLGAQAGDPALRERHSGHLRAGAATPPCFIWHTLTDDEVPAAHSELFAAALRANGVPYELHLYGHGAHALGLARDEGLHWAEDCLRWFAHQGLLSAGGGR
ncbi:alpha/beta hydrolase [Dactylosporangium vinaceum]|uniref:Alpha/beta hydrolase n=1 Tax=Dactylosporangium vinaceum TaxID=53362 RepID=A0ABV5MS76_9ACTN|nr:alpha/beta hydrolase [Dactylosporangium vinaceum]UAC00216.1 alpha/beta hydrolase [Dactylosporangium vinaceum]